MNRVCVVGAGAVGGNLTVRLANAGVDVTVIARGANAAAIRERGFILKTSAATLSARPRVCTDMAEAGAQDAVFVAVKGQSIPEIAAGLPALCGAQTPVVFLLNGIPWWYPLGNARLPHPWPDLGLLDPGKVLERTLGIERVIGSVVYAGNALLEPGVVLSTAPTAGMISIGEPDGSKSERIAALGQMLEAAGYKAPIAADIREAVWTKMVGSNLASMLVCTLLDKPLAVFSQNAELAALSRNILREGMAVAKAWGKTLPLEPEGAHDPAKLTNNHKPSMAQDFEKGRMLEIDPILTAFQRLARAAKVPTPHFDAGLALLVQRAMDAGLYGR